LSAAIRSNEPKDSNSNPIVKTTILHLIAAAALPLRHRFAHGADAPKMKMTTDIPPSITTPDQVKTRLI
jgi:hypothetical protein